MSYFFDSYAIIALAEGIPSYDSYQGIEIITSVLNIGEIYQIILRKQGKQSADTWFKKINFKLIEISPEAIIEAVHFRHLNKKMIFLCLMQSGILYH